MYKEELVILEDFEIDLFTGWDYAIKELGIKVDKQPRTQFIEVLDNAINNYYHAYKLSDKTINGADSGLCGIIRTNTISLLLDLLKELREQMLSE